MMESVSSWTKASGSKENLAIAKSTAALERRGARRILAALLQPFLEALVAAGRGRHAGKPDLVVLKNALRLRQRKLAEQKERLPRARRDPVRIAAAGIQKRPRRLVRFRLGKPDQFVLDLERAEILEFCVDVRICHGSKPRVRELGECRSTEQSIGAIERCDTRVLPTVHSMLLVRKQNLASARIRPTSTL